jgi:hypothetical protein
MIEFDLMDCWREQNLEVYQYTWFKKNPIEKARLDFFLISSTLFTDLDSTYILPGYRTDHSMVVLNLEMGKFKKGTSYWKFNNSLLKDLTFVQQTKELIKDIKLRYALEHQNSNIPNENIPDSEIIFSIDDKLFFETLMMEIRGKTIAYSSFKKKTGRQKRKRINC